mmetsp:Transcript_98933/g.236060  ORF Transcript_98933/g.236060 Transcript_98933/m.236060 type:complete len:208 (-) Transcript_98933:472-1095(-)
MVPVVHGHGPDVGLRSAVGLAVADHHGPFTGAPGSWGTQWCLGEAFDARHQFGCQSCAGGRAEGAGALVIQVSDWVIHFHQSAAALALVARGRVAGKRWARCIGHAPVLQAHCKVFRRVDTGHRGVITPDLPVLVFHVESAVHAPFEMAPLTWLVLQCPPLLLLVFVEAQIALTIGKEPLRTVDLQHQSLAAPIFSKRRIGLLVPLT